MSLTIGLLLGLSFVVSLLALTFLIWAIANRQLSFDQSHADTIFVTGEIGTPDDPNMAGGDLPAEGANHFDTARAGIDQVSQFPVLVLLTRAIFWLVLGSIFGRLASLKLHWPDLASDSAALTFGRVRTVHLNVVIFGWLSLAGIAVAMWVSPRIFHTALRYPRLPVVGAVLWNAAIASGEAAIASGWTDGQEWLEIPWQIDSFLAVAGALFAIPLVATAFARTVDHIYITGWYFLGALCWFPVLFIIANVPGLYSGVQQATINWWFAHNQLRPPHCANLMKRLSPMKGLDLYHFQFTGSQ
jgi:cytochrome c oxidase cbb3-type subunit I